MIRRRRRFISGQGITSRQWGRFLTRDTYTGEDDEPLSLHLYTYCENDGVNAWDSSGHKKYKKFKQYFNNKYKKIKNYVYSSTSVYLKGNKVTVKSKLIITGGKKSKRKIIKNGIEEKWSGKVNIKGYKVKVKTCLITKYDESKGDYNRFEYIKGAGTSHVKCDGNWDIESGHSGEIYSKFSGGKKRSEKKERC